MSLDDTTPLYVQMSVAESTLQNLLTEDGKVELNAQTRMLSLLSTETPHILAQQRFTSNEWKVFIILLTSHPYYAPYEIIMAGITLLSPSTCRKRLQDAQQLDPKMLQRELKPIHRALAGVRLKLKDLAPHLKVSLIRELGYALVTSSDNC